jgi:hypothetical protein
MKTPAWQRKEGKSASGGLNAKGRASYNASTGGNLKPPVKSGDNPRRASFLARCLGLNTKMGSRQDYSYPSEPGVQAQKQMLRRKPRQFLPETRQRGDQWLCRHILRS